MPKSPEMSPCSSRYLVPSPPVFSSSDTQVISTLPAGEKPIRFRKAVAIMAAHTPPFISTLPRP